MSAIVKTSPLKYTDLQNVCRTCLGTGKLFNLYELLFEDILASNIIEQITGEKIDPNDGTPQNICKKCSVDLLNISEFLNTYKKAKIQFEETLNHYRAYINKFKDDSKEVPSRFDKNKQKAKEAAKAAEFIDLDSTVDNEDSQANKEKENKSCPKKLQLTTTAPLVKEVYSARKVHNKCKLCKYQCERKKHRSRFMQMHYLKEHLLDTRSRAYKCFKCRLDFKSFDELLAHYPDKKHQNLRCRNCKAQFDNFLDFYTHIVRMNRKSRRIQDEASGFKSYKCLHCNGLRLYSFHEMIKHFSKDHNNEEVCMICREVIEESMISHLLEHRPVAMKFFCVNCWISFGTNEELDEHKRDADHTKRKCPICEELFPANQFHLHTHEDEDANILICEICEKEFPNNAAYERHFEAIHLGVRFNCDKCLDGFTTAEELTKHKEEEHAIPKKKNYVKNSICEVCGREFLTENMKSFKLHQASHKFGHKFICNRSDCDKTFLDKELLNSHLAENHEAFACHFCSELFLDAALFKTHYEQHLWLLKFDENTSNTCPLCNIEFANKHVLESHAKNEHLLFICPHDNCFKSFLAKIQMENHQLTHKKLKCRFCTREFRSKIFHSRHELAHEMSELHFCTLCNSAFSDRNSKKSHIQHCHKKDESVSCRFCGYQSTKQVLLEKHEKLHNKSKSSFGCPYCSQKFPDGFLAEEHINEHLKTPNSNLIMPEELSKDVVEEEMDFEECETQEIQDEEIQIIIEDC